MSAPRSLLHRLLRLHLLLSPPRALRERDMAGFTDRIRYVRSGGRATYFFSISLLEHRQLARSVHAPRNFTSKAGTLSGRLDQGPLLSGVHSWSASLVHLQCAEVKGLGY